MRDADTIVERGASQGALQQGVLIHLQHACNMRAQESCGSSKWVQSHVRVHAGPRHGLVLSDSAVSADSTRLMLFPCDSSPWYHLRAEAVPTRAANSASTPTMRLIDPVVAKWRRAIVLTATYVRMVWGEGASARFMPRSAAAHEPVPCAVDERSF